MAHPAAPQSGTLRSLGLLSLNASRAATDTTHTAVPALDASKNCVERVNGPTLTLIGEHVGTRLTSLKLESCRKIRDIGFVEVH
jgi:hypothetical protein